MKSRGLPSGVLDDASIQLDLSALSSPRLDANELVGRLPASVAAVTVSDEGVVGHSPADAPIAPQLELHRANEAPSAPKLQINSNDHAAPLGVVQDIDPGLVTFDVSPRGSAGGCDNALASQDSPIWNLGDANVRSVGSNLTYLLNPNDGIDTPHTPPIASLANSFFDVTGALSTDSIFVFAPGISGDGLFPRPPFSEPASLAPKIITYGDLGLAAASTVQATTTSATTTQGGSGLVINVSYDSSVSNAPASFTSVVAAVVQFFESQFSNPVTLNIDVGWGEVAGQSLGSGALGESDSYLQSFSYSQIRNALLANASSGAQISAANSLPTSAPASGTYYLTLADATALGLISGSTTLDGYVGFSSTSPFAYSTSGGVPAGEYDLYAVVAHEISEVMGRISMLDSSRSYSDFDLFRFSGVGVRTFNGTATAYFSADGGNTNLNYFNSNASGDFGDWANSAGNDSFDAFSNSGVVNPVTAADITAMNVLGYNVGSPTPPIPTITSVAETPSSGDLNAGKTVTITLHFNTSVTVAGGPPKLALNDGGIATYSGGSGTTALTFSYVVGASDTNVPSLTVNSVNLNGATIAGTAGNAQLSLSGLPQSGPQIDTTIPALTSITETPNSGTVNVGQAVVFKLNFTEAVRVSGNPTLALNDSGIATYTGGSGTSTLTFTYTVSASDQNVAALAATSIKLNNGSIQDGAANAANLSLTGIGQTGPNVDNLALIGISETPSSGDLNAGQPVTIVLNFNSAVAFSGGTPTLTLNDGGVATYSGGGGTSALTFGYLVSAADSNVSSLAVGTVNLNGASITGSAGNAQLSLSGLTQSGPEIDTTIPAVSSIGESPTSGTVSVGQTVTLRVNFTEAVTVSGTPTITLNDGGVATFSGGSGSNTLTFSYLVSTNDQSIAALSATAIYLNGGSIQDGGGNDAVISISGLSQSGPKIYIPPSPMAQVDAIYQAILQRAPTSAEMTAGLTENASFGYSEVISSVVNSPESQQYVYPIVQVVELATGAFPTAAQLAGWVPAVESGTTLPQMALAFVGSDQFGATYNGGTAVNPNAPISAPIVTAIIQHALSTTPSPAQVNAWVSSGLTIDQVFVDFALGDQYTSAIHGIVQQYLTSVAENAIGNSSSSLASINPNDALTVSQVQAAYQMVLQGTPTNVEANAALSIDATMGNLGAFSAIIDSPEAQQAVYPVSQIILLATGSLPTQAQLAGWVPAVKSGTSLDQMASSFVGSTAFGDTYNNGTPVNPNAPITAPIVTAIIEHALGITPTASQVNGWVSTGLTIDQVFVDFALGAQYSSAIQSTIQSYLTAVAINGAHLNIVDGLQTIGLLTLGTPVTPLSDNGVTILGGSGTVQVVASGTGDIITELNTNTQGGGITANGNGDVITIANGINTVTANGAGDQITLGVVSTGTTITGVQTIHAAGAGDIITFATTASDGTSVSWGTGATSIVDGGSSTGGNIGANDTVNFGNNIGGGSETVVATGAIAGATTAGGTTTSGIAMTTLGNVVDGSGDQIVFNNAVTEVLTGANAIDVSSANSLAHALDTAASAAAGSQPGGLIGAHTGVLDWFQFNGNTYVVEAVNSSASAAVHPGLAASDEVIKIVGLVNLAGESLAGHVVLL